MPIVLPEGAPDPVATLKPVPGVDYWELARANMTVAESGVLDMQRLAKELVALKEREGRGTVFLLRSDISEEDWKEGRHLLQSIQEDIHSAELELAAVEMQVWKATCSTYVAVQMFRRTGHPPSVALGGQGEAITPSQVSSIIEADSSALESIVEPRSDITKYNIPARPLTPQLLWQRLVGDREPPGSFPLEEKDLTLETMKAWPYNAGHWEADELESLLEQKR